MFGNNTSSVLSYSGKFIVPKVTVDSKGAVTAIEEWSGEFLKGNLDSSVVYVFRNEDYTKEYDEVVKNKNANKYELPEHIVITVDK